MKRLLINAFRLHRRAKRLIQLIVDAVLIVACFCIAIVLHTESFTPLTNYQTWNPTYLGVPATLWIFSRLGFYRMVIRYSHLSRDVIRNLVLGMFSSAVILYSLGKLLGNSLPLSLLTTYALLTGAGVVGTRYICRSLFHGHILSRKTRVIIYGAGAAGSQLAGALRQGKQYEPMAFVDDWRGMHGTEVEGLRVYPPKKLQRLIDTHKAEHVLLAIPSAKRSRRREILSDLAPLNVPVQTIPGIEDVVAGHAKIQDIQDVAIEDLLGRDAVPAMQELLDANIRGKVVLVTGAGGSIGSELCRQIIHHNPARLLLVDNCEYAIYAIHGELISTLQQQNLPVVVVPLLGSVQEKRHMSNIMSTYSVQTVYHAAAYKHVPMVENNVVEGIRNNVFGTLATAQAAIETGVDTFVLISTDKAVRPTNVMGTTKRLAELICQALGATEPSTRFCMVRFGNVLGSSGSVIPLFRKQISIGGPITVTDEKITRYFMTIPEATTLVLQAGAMAKNGEVFILDMGEPVKIVELARQMIRLSGLEERKDDGKGGDIEIVFTGLRPGEKLHEELLIGEDARPSLHPRIMSSRESYWKWNRLEEYLRSLDTLVQEGDVDAIHKILLESPALYSPNGPSADCLWQRKTENKLALVSKQEANMHDTLKHEKNLPMGI